jgi:peptide/nickel transport system permease protein
MVWFAFRRIGASVPVLFGVTIVVFAMLHLIPGDPAKILLFGANPTPQQIADLREKLGLERSLPEQYVIYLGHIVRGDLGTSYLTNTSVGHEIASRLPSTIVLACSGMAVAVLLGIPLGIIAGLRPGTVVDRASMAIAVLGVAVPYFWLALLLVLLFAVHLGWLPSLGTGSPQAIVLPAVALGVGFASIIARLLRTSVIAVYQTSYILAARARGVRPSVLLIRHALKNALIAGVTIIGLEFGTMLSGAVVIEVIFGRPGLGSYVVTAIRDKDIPAVQGTVLVIAALYLGINLAVDLVYGFLDPRIRTQLRRGVD